MLHFLIFFREPKNFAVEIEILLINNIFEGFFIYWGDISLITYPNIEEFLIDTLYFQQNFQKEKNVKNMLSEQKKLLQEKFIKHGSRIFQKVIFSFKDFERVDDEELLYNLLLYLLNNNIITFHEVKMFPFFQKLITSSVKSQYLSQRRISQESKEKNLNSYDESSSYNDKSHISRDKFKKNLDKTPDSYEEEDVQSCNFVSKVRKACKVMKREMSFKTVQSLKMKDNPFGKSQEFNLILKSSMDSNHDLEFSSYSEQNAESDIEDIQTLSNNFKIHKRESLKKMYKSSWSFSFD